MGWKNVKEFYKIEHIVQTHENKIFIGSPYVHDLMTIYSNGDVELNKIVSGKEMKRISDVMLTDKNKLIELVSSSDSFSQSLPVYTYRDGKILEKFCEEYGWPNITHDGQIMYDNTFFVDRMDALKKGIENARCGVKMMRENLEHKEKELDKYRGLVTEEETELASYLQIEKEISCQTNQ